MAAERRRAWQRLRHRIWHRAQDDRDLQDEIRFHLAEETQHRVEAGMTAVDASATARRDFGNVGRVAEITRDGHGLAWLTGWLQDVRFAARLLRRNRLFAFFSIASLALGIGATTAIFSLFDAIVLRPLAARDPDRLVALSFSVGANRTNSFMPYPHFAAMRDSNRTLDGLFAWTRAPRVSVGLQGVDEIGSTLRASGDYYPTLGLTPALGRLLTRDDDTPGAAAAVISHAYWQRRFGGSASAIGTTVSLNRLPFTVVGVEPKGFTGPTIGVASDITIPLRAGDRFGGSPRIYEDAFATWIEIMGRLRADASHEQATQDLNQIFAAVNADASRAAPKDAFAARVAREARLFVRPGAWGGPSGLRNGYERWLRLLLGMLAAVVLLASLNVATLLLARSAARGDEIATRLAIGAGRWRIVRQLLTEASVIAVLGGAFGLALAWWASQFLLRVVVTDTATLPLDPTPSLRAFAFAAGITMATAVLFGLVPALRATARRRHSSARVPNVGRRRILERGLVAAQTAMSLVLLVFAALFVRSLQNLLALDPGYDRSQVLLFSVDAGLAGGKPEDARQRYLALLDALRSQPGVESASVSAVAPVSTSYYFVSGLSKLGTVEFPEDQRLRIAFNVVTPGYFATLRIPLLAGRDFTPQDRVGTQSVVIVSERLAAKFKGNPIGQLIGSRNDTQEVIGVARDNRYANVKDAPRDVTYSSMLQGDSIRFSPTYEIRYRGAGREAMDTVRRTIAATDAALTPFQMMTLDDRTRDSLARERLLAMISTYIGAFAVLLACIGLYGLLTYSVAQRTPELGLRMALGSEPRGVRRIVLAESLVTVAIGALGGLAAAWMLVGLARTQLHAMEPTDPIAFAAALALLLAMAGIASYLPAWRASRINPVIALRRE